MKWSVNEKLLRDEECKCEIESRNSRKLRRLRCFFILKTLGILCLVPTLAGCGLLFAFGSAECVVLDGSNVPDNDSSSIFVPQCSSIQKDERADCWPESGDVDEQKCTQRGCCWKSADESSPRLGGVPWCFYPSNYQGYTVQSLQKTTYGMRVQLHTTQPSWWPNEVQHVTLDVQYDSAERLHFKFYDPNHPRYEVPVQLNKTTHHTLTTDYIVDVPSSGTFYIKVTRRSTGKILFNTQDAAPLVFTDQFLQLGTQLSTKYIYGLGEHRSAFLQSTDWTKMAFWSRDQPPSPNTNLYGVHPFYLNVEDDHKTHGVFLLNSNAMEAELQPAPALTYRTTGGVLDFYIFTGPTPDQIVQQYTALIGRPFMPPYWALGFHLCRWGYNRGSSGMKDVIDRMRAAKMPYCLFRVEKGILDGLDLAVFACKEQFQRDFWNCPVTANSIVSKATSSEVTREISFLQAITAAGIMYATTKSSTREDNVLCECVKDNYVDAYTDKAWAWGGCSHNVKCGKKVSKLFLGTNAESMHIDQVMKRHNERSGHGDVQWNDIDYMKDHLDWTYDKNHFNDLPDIVADLHNNGQHYIMIIDPGISNTQGAGNYTPYDDGIKMNVFIKKADGSGPIIGKVWPGDTAFPDFFHPNAESYWTKLAQTYHNEVPFDGIWIDMNEPSNFYTGSVSGCPDNTIDNPPWLPPVLAGSTLRDKTLCASAIQHISTHYNLHSLYGHSEAVVTKRALDSILGNKRSLIISRSTYPSTGVHSGHWTGDNNAQWIDTYYSITGMLNFNLFGIPMIGSDICGFNGDTNPELCTRWMQLGAFYPFMRNHNTKGDKDQDPAVFDEATQNIMRDALNLRYTLLPYLYTLFYRSHVDGTPIIRPLFYQYPVSVNDAVYSVDVQFMWGTGLLITPATSQSTTQGQGYLPADRWYDWFDHSIVDSPGHFVNFPLPMEHINLKIKGGSIIPLQTPAVTTTLSRKNKFTILAALSPSGTANGELYWDDGESRDSISGGKYNLITFQVSQGSLTSTVQIGGYTSESMLLGEVQVLGVDTPPSSVSVNGRTLSSSDYMYARKVLTVKNLSENIVQRLTVAWL